MKLYNLIIVIILCSLFTEEVLATKIKKISEERKRKTKKSMTTKKTKSKIKTKTKVEYPIIELFDAMKYDGKKDSNSAQVFDFGETIKKKRFQ